MTTDDLCVSENLKRERNITPQERWKFIEAAIAFADAQQPRSRNHPTSCKEKEKILLAGLIDREN